MNKIIRTITQFVGDIDQLNLDELTNIKETYISSGYQVQTIRVCHPGDFGEGDSLPQDLLVSVGRKPLEYITDNFNLFVSSRDNVNLELTDEDVQMKHVQLLFRIIQEAPSKTFNFTFTLNNAKSSPYMPSADYEKDGFSIGLQPTDLSVSVTSIAEWFERMKDVYSEVVDLMESNNQFLGIDSSIAPLFENESSLINLIKRLYGNFSDSILTDVYTDITKFIKQSNPRPVGLCGLMVPCLEDFELAREYEQGNFSIERSLFLSLHSGLGIDVFPIGVDENKEKILNILKLVKALSDKYNKPLSVRFVSDGNAKIGDKTNFNNQYLYDTVVRAL